MEQTEFEHIARRVRQKAVRTALACSVGTERAEDIGQDVMLRLWTIRKDIDGEVSAEKLAACIARNLATDCHRRRRTISLDTRYNTIDEKQPQPDIFCEITANQAWLVRRMEALPPTEHRILRLRQVERKTNEEIAALLGIEKTSVATLLARARKKLFDEFKERERR